MQIEFLGVGEAFDTGLGNSSFIVQAESPLLIDCGFAIPDLYFSSARPANFLSGIYLTHFHADHVFGLPALLIRLREDGRTKPITCLGQPGVAHYVEKLVELAYPGNFKKLGYDLEFIEIREPTRFNEFSLSFAATIHGVRNLAICIEYEDEKIAFSGDGEITSECRALYKDCSVLVHEAYTFDTHVSGHTSATELLEAASEFSSLESLFLVHISRHERRAKAERFAELGAGKTYSVILPEPGFEYSLL